MRSFVRLAIVTVIVTSSAAVMPSAHALFHLMKVTEIFAGTSDQPDAQFIEMQMYAENQRFLTSHEVVVYDEAGLESGRFTFTAPVDNGANQAYVLLATAQAQELFGVTADLEIDAALAAAGGKACFMSNQQSPIDCASWGSYSGDGEGSGTPFNSPIGLVAGRSMERDISGGESSDALDAGDDTDDSAADFDLASPSPTNNAGSGSQTAEHERAVTLSLRERAKLVASGRVSSEFDGCAHGVAVKIQRKRAYGWKVVGSTTTSDTGSYRKKVPLKGGTYRARVPASTPEEGHGCRAAVSPKRRT